MTPADSKLARARDYLQTRGLVPAQRTAGAAWYNAERVHTPGSVVLRRWQNHRAALAAGVAAKRAAPRRAERSFVAAGNGPMLAGMSAIDWNVNQSLFRGLRAMRARSNELAKNNDLARGFLRMVKTNVIGAVGIAFQAQVRDNAGTLIQADGQKIEKAWKAFGQRDACDVAGALSWLEFQQLYALTLARDGETLVRRYKGRGPHGYQLQLLSPALLDETYCKDLANGHRIRMGIEFDPQWKPVTYWLAQDTLANPYMVGGTSRRYEPVPASEIWHDFVPEWVGQWRGFPWMATSIATMHRLGEFEDAGLQAAEQGAKQLSWIETPTGDLEALGNRQAVESAGDASQALPDDDDELAPTAGTVWLETGQGVHYAALPPGYKPVTSESKYPDASAPDFIKHFQRRMATGLGVPYHQLANNLADVNLSSLRGGEAEAREVWKTLQGFIVERLCARVYAEWLPMAMLAGAVPLPYAQLPRYLEAASWQPRRWASVDPLKDIEADEREIGLGATSLTRVIREKGRDPDEVFDEIRRERDEHADVFEILAALQKPAATPSQPDPTPPKE